MAECYSDVIDQLVEQRHKQGISQVALAEATELAQPVIARFEKKKVIPRLDTLLRIAAALNCEVKIVPSKGLSPEEFEAKLMQFPVEEPDELDKAMLAEAEAINDGTTVSLLSIPGMREKLLSAAAEPLEECVPEREVQW